jgi:excisionase family DNA binding protein
MNNPFEILEARLVNIEAMLRELLLASQQNIDSPLDSEQAASFINLELPTLYNLVQKRKIPFHRQGKKLYFFKKDLVSWIKEQPLAMDVHKV